MRDTFRVGDWLVDPGLGTLTDLDEEIHLEPRVMEVLVYLAEHAGEVVTKEQLFLEVWRETFVTDEALTYCIHSLRKALRDPAKEPRFIQTITKKGYRLIAPVSRRVGGPAPETGPYPGLAPFLEESAQNFFGREEEARLLSERVHRRPMMALIGPSGVGKTSLVRAGLVPCLPQGWQAVVCTPGESPFSRLAQALVGALAADTEALRSLFEFEDLEVAVSVLRRWRRAHDEVLLVVDQFEELFALNPEQVQSRFAELIGRATRELSIHVLLVLRDDFLMHCHRYECLAPVFAELMPIGAPSPEALQRALIEPARQSGYAFEDEALPGEMVSEVARERGALPLVAFAVTRIWEERDRDRKLMTRKAYEDIGGVAGALAQHADATLERIGHEGHEIVREIFRNLVTARGTRVSRDQNELLSVFPAREDASKALQTLIDARLLTSYEVPDREGAEPSHRIEIIHESLLKHWPRLVRWQTQDADAAQLRDQLRQAAQLWESRDRPRELLWTGKPFRQFCVWREDYPGKLSKIELAFADTMTSNAERGKRRRRLAWAGLVVGLLAVVTLVTAMWRRSENLRREAVLEAGRREAAELMALGRLKLEGYPTASLAYSLASLERADSFAARRLALEALWRGPTAFVLPQRIQSVAFSPDGRWLATGSIYSGVQLWPRAGGSPRTVTGSDETMPHLFFGPDADLLVTAGKSLRFWSVPGMNEIRRIETEGRRPWVLLQPSSFITFARTPDNARVVRAFPLVGGEPRELGRWDTTDVTDFVPGPRGEWIAFARGDDVYVKPLERSDAHLIGKHADKVQGLSFHPDGDKVVAADESGEIRIWPIAPSPAAPLRTLRGTFKNPEILRFDRSGSRLVIAPQYAHSTSEVAHVWDLTGPPDAEPRVLLNGDAAWMNWLAVHPNGRRVAAGHDGFGTIWPLSDKYVRVFRGQSPPFIHVDFTPDGSSLVSASDDGTLRLWPLSPSAGEHGRILIEEHDEARPERVRFRVDPTGRYVLTGNPLDQRQRVFLTPLAGGETRLIHGLGKAPAAPLSYAYPFAFSADGRRAAVAVYPPSRIRIVDLHTGDGRVLDVGDEDCGLGKGWKGVVTDLGFTPDGHLITAGVSGIRLWNLEDGTSRVTRPCDMEEPITYIDVSNDGRHVLVADVNDETRHGALSLLDLEENKFREIPSHGNRVNAVALDPSGTIAVSGDLDGVVRAGPINGDEPHLLLGHHLEISSVTVSPDGRWIASAGQDGTIRLWPMPDMDQQPFHSLPHEELLRRLRSLTNLRVVADESSSAGYKLEVGPFPGWETMPQW